MANRRTESELKVFRTVEELRSWRQSLPEGKSVGFVPTMGALHPGHESLLKRARLENEFVVLSIFVNPTQFNQDTDLENYPRAELADLEVARGAGADAVFLPESAAEIYPEGYRYQVAEVEFSKVLEGLHRPGHFEGMLTVVLKLFGLVRPTRAYFGEKDFQQLELIRGMVRAFFLDLEVVGCPTIREEDGLAMSSRNQLLTLEERKVAPKLYEAMTDVADVSEARALLEQNGFRLDYLEDFVVHDGETRRFVAAYLGGTRLIDNISLDAVKGSLS
jgi:pantoate--beta-alanine ligase